MTQPGYSMYYASPLGRLKLESDGAALTALSFEGACPSSSVNPGAETVKPLPVFAETCRWLDIYFSGGVPDFIPALNLQGSAFRQAVWKILLEIPYGVTTTYGEIAAPSDITPSPSSSPATASSAPTEALPATPPAFPAKPGSSITKASVMSMLKEGRRRCGFEESAGFDTRNV